MKKFENIQIDFDDELMTGRWFFTCEEKGYAKKFEIGKEITPVKQIQVIEDMLTCMKKIITRNKNKIKEEIIEEKKYYGHPLFYQLLDELKEIHSQKNHDYAGEDDPLKNFRMSENMGIPAWKGCLIRISDKFSRLCSFAKKEEYEVKDESIEDTLKDLAVYSLICLILYRGENNS